LIWEAAQEFLRRSVDVVLDDGFFLRQNPIRYIDLARIAGATAKIHFLATPENIIRGWLIRRNTQLAPFNFYIEELRSVPGAV
jgi:predicted kinase